MKFLAILAISAATLTICISSDIPTIPGDNSHYVEGESRYIWMPDGKGVPHLVDLLATEDNNRILDSILGSRDGSDNRYYLYTRSNPTTAQELISENATSIASSNFNSSLPLRVIVHGWNNDYTSNVNVLLTAAFLDRENVNVICVDWSDLASRFYTVSAAGVPSVGQYLGNFLVWLMDLTGSDWNEVHMVGHSLGAHVLGTAGRIANGTAARITGMDPAGPTWGNNPDALNTSSAQYVETINTDGGLLGIFTPIGHANFYPNGGRNPQPGCLISTCSHSRSYELMEATIYHNHKIALECETIEEADSNRCTGTRNFMGNISTVKTLTGNFSVSTGSEYPY